MRTSFASDAYLKYKSGSKSQLCVMSTSVYQNSTVLHDQQPGFVQEKRPTHRTDFPTLQLLQPFFDIKELLISFKFNTKYVHVFLGHAKSSINQEAVAIRNIEVCSEEGIRRWNMRYNEIQ